MSDKVGGGRLSLNSLIILVWMIVLTVFVFFQFGVFGDIQDDDFDIDYRSDVDFGREENIIEVLDSDPDPDYGDFCGCCDLGEDCGTVRGVPVCFDSMGNIAGICRGGKDLCNRCGFGDWCELDLPNMVCVDSAGMYSAVWGMD